MGWDDAAKKAGVGHRARDIELLEALTDRGSSNQGAQDAFCDMLHHLRGNPHRELTPKQRQWVESEAERTGVAPAANLFSSMTVDEQRRELERAGQMRLAVDDMPRPTKPPGRS